jgi:hypothetical protein
LIIEALVVTLHGKELVDLKYVPQIEKPFYGDEAVLQGPGECKRNNRNPENSQIYYVSLGGERV